MADIPRTTPGAGAPDAVAPAGAGEEGGLRELTPRQIVEELDQYIIGQDDAKRAVAVALRNRWRRRNVGPELRDEIFPANIIMIGPTGVGKTEIARRLARLAGAPFLKVEASKFTEVGYVGRDVESMVRDLVDIAIDMVRSERQERVREEAEERVEERLLDLLLPPVAPEGGRRGPDGRGGGGASGGGDRTFVVSSRGEARPEDEARDGEEDGAASEDRRRRTREKLRSLLRDGELEDRTVEVEVTQSSMPMLDFDAPGMEGVDWSVGEMLQEMMPQQTKRREVTVAEARRILLNQELERMVDEDEVVDEALERVENMGIVFLDEIDKVADDRSGSAGGADVSRQGVQRDLLPIVEGSSVPTKYGMVDTDHVLFVAAGAFHGTSPSDLIPELQGRFPIRVELHSLDEEDFVRILQEPRNALLLQYRALVETEDADLTFTDEAIRELARIAAEVNRTTENIGARRLHTVLTTLLEDVMFELPEGGERRIEIDADFVRDELQEVLEDEDLRRYIL